MEGALNDEWIKTALMITGHFENSSDPLGGVTGDFDDMGISLGVLQWNSGPDRFSRLSGTLAGRTWSLRCRSMEAISGRPAPATFHTVLSSCDDGKTAPGYSRRSLRNSKLLSGALLSLTSKSPPRTTWRKRPGQARRRGMRRTTGASQVFTISAGSSTFTLRMPDSRTSARLP